MSSTFTKIAARRAFAIKEINIQYTKNIRNFGKVTKFCEEIMSIMTS